MTVDDQIQKLNDEVRCSIAPSPIHGIGVFALRDIKKNESLNTLKNFFKEPFFYRIPPERFKNIRPEIARLILDRWAQSDLGVPFQSPNDDANMMSFMNHSDTPNSALGYATRDIAKGEEVTEDYRKLGIALGTLQTKHYSFL